MSRCLACTAVSSTAFQRMLLLVTEISASLAALVLWPNAPMHKLGSHALLSCSLSRSPMYIYTYRLPHLFCTLQLHAACL
jgi:hypothetical protein